MLEMLRILCYVLIWVRTAASDWPIHFAYSSLAVCMAYFPMWIIYHGLCTRCSPRFSRRWVGSLGDVCTRYALLFLVYCVSGRVHWLLDYWWTP